MNTQTKHHIINNYTKLCNAVHNMKGKPLNLKNLQRKLSPFCRTNRLGDTLFLRLPLTNQGVRITILPKLEGFPTPRVTIFSKNHPSMIFDLSIDTNKQLMSKILFKHKLLKVDAYVS